MPKTTYEELIQKLNHNMLVSYQERVPLLKTVLAALGHPDLNYRIIHWGPRTIDLDILFFNNDHVSSPELTIPHPEIPNRRFVLIPMLEVSQDDPELHRTIQALLDVTPDKNMVRIYNSGSEDIEPTQNWKSS